MLNVVMFVKILLSQMRILCVENVSNVIEINIENKN